MSNEKAKQAYNDYCKRQGQEPNEKELEEWQSMWNQLDADDHAAALEALQEANREQEE